MSHHRGGSNAGLAVLQRWSTIEPRCPVHHCDHCPPPPTVDGLLAVPPSGTTSGAMSNATVPAPPAAMKGSVSQQQTPGQSNGGSRSTSVQPHGPAPTAAAGPGAATTFRELGKITPILGSTFSRIQQHKASPHGPTPSTTPAADVGKGLSMTGHPSGPRNGAGDGEDVENKVPQEAVRARRESLPDDAGAAAAAYSKDSADPTAPVAAGTTTPDKQAAGEADGGADPIPANAGENGDKDQVQSENASGDAQAARRVPPLVSLPAVGGTTPVTGSPNHDGGESFPSAPSPGHGSPTGASSPGTASLQSGSPHSAQGRPPFAPPSSTTAAPRVFVGVHQAHYATGSGHIPGARPKSPARKGVAHARTQRGSPRSSPQRQRSAGVAGAVSPRMAADAARSPRGSGNRPPTQSPRAAGRRLSDNATLAPQRSIQLADVNVNAGGTTSEFVDVAVHDAAKPYHKQLGPPRNSCVVAALDELQVWAQPGALAPALTAYGRAAGDAPPIPVIATPSTSADEDHPIDSVEEARAGDGSEEKVPRTALPSWCCVNAGCCLDMAEYERAITAEEDADQRRAATYEDKNQGAASGIALKMRSVVSQNKNRFKQDGFDLDLTYITPKIIAMGFPSTGRESYFRNPMEQVEKFFSARHAGHFRIYNLCSERQYDSTKFGGNFRRFPFDDHNAPCPAALMPEFVHDAQEFLQLHEDNVVAIHCKAGKGRTGVMISCLLMATEQDLRVADTAIDQFGAVRTNDSQGVTIPSQKRYIRYYDRILAWQERARSVSAAHGQGATGSGVGGARLAASMPPARTVQLKKLVFNSTVKQSSGVCDLYFILCLNGKERLDSRRRFQGLGSQYFSPKHQQFVFDFEAVPPPPELLRGDSSADVKEKEPVGPLTLLGDVKIFVFTKSTVLSDDELFHFWFNTTFCDTPVQVLRKMELDKAVKDTKHQLLAPDLAVHLFFEGEGTTTDGPAPAVAPTVKKEKKKGFFSGLFK